MNAPHNSRTFKSGNSVAVRLPAGFAIPAGAEVELAKSGDTVTIKLTRDPAEVRRRLRKLTADMEAIGAPPDGVQKREPFDWPDRPGLL
jgi:virulence-associated protein VagC